MTTITDPTVSAAAKQQQAINSVAGAYEMLKSTAGAAINSVIGATQEMLGQWILTGQMSGKVFAQIAASVVSGLVVQAGVKALFELAEGFAALANPLTAWLAPMHFTAAKTYGLVAGAAGVAATGLRTVIGDKFSNQEAGTNAVNSASSTTRNSLNSENTTRIINESRIAGENYQQKDTKIKFEFQHTHTQNRNGEWETETVERAFHDNWNRSGSIRERIKNATQSDWSYEGT